MADTMERPLTPQDAPYQEFNGRVWTVSSTGPAMPVTERLTEMECQRELEWLQLGWYRSVMGR